MENIDKNYDELLQSEGGMFLMELETAMRSAEELIAASTVDESLKKKCLEILHSLHDAAKDDPEQIDPYNLARVCMIQLTDILNDTDGEQSTLYNALKEIVLRARNSAKKWPWPPASPNA